ncbi:RIO1 family-domain-containing protein [Sparassis latifolia]
MEPEAPETTHEIIENGQFDDAPESADPVVPSAHIDPRTGHNFIDEENILAWSSDSGAEDDNEAEEEYDAFDAEEDDLEAAAFHTLRAEDEDWEVAERDFTKQYNRVRQHVAVRTGAAHGIASAMNNRSVVAPLPAVNRPRAAKVVTSAPASATSGADRTASQLEALAKYSSRIRNIDMPYDLGVGVNRKGPSASANVKDKRDRATSEQVLDPRTRIILFKMIGRGLIFEINGCVSTGKEANVYHALTLERRHIALKIYKTSILVFKDRDKYVTGEYRFRRGYSRHNPRKMVRIWAEKEMRNLKRLRTAGICCPEPVEVRENVLVMGFVGDKEGWASPRLKDAEIPAAIIPDLYVELLLMVRKIYLECKLVHADLSEYNVLYHVESSPSPPAAEDSSHLETEPGPFQQEYEPSQQEVDQDHRGHLWIIDVSQSVEHDHPHAFDFLRSDLRNVEDFFARRSVHCVGLRRAFEFVTREVLPPPGENDGAEAVLRAWMEAPEPEAAADGAESRSENGVADADGAAPGPSSAAAAHEDSVFMHSYIPRTLNEVYDPERDVGALARGEGEKLIYRDTIGIVVPKDRRKDSAGKNGETTAEARGRVQMSKVHFQDEGGDNTDDSDESEDEEQDDDSSEGIKKGFEERQPRGHRHEDKDAKKVRISICCEHPLVLM